MKTKTLIITLAAIIAVCSALIAFRDRSDKSIAVILKSGKVVKTIDMDSLSEGFEYSIDEHNTVLLTKEGASMIYADCPDKECIRMGTKRNGSIICLPNRVEIKIVSDEEDDVDAYTK